MKRLSIFLIMVALVVGMVGCGVRDARLGDILSNLNLRIG